MECLQFYYSHATELMPTFETMADVEANRETMAGTVKSLLLPG